MLLRDDVSSQGVEPLEIEANAFASELLMPNEFLMTALRASGLDIEDDAGIEALARKFRVSSSAMRYRLGVVFYFTGVPTVGFFGTRIYFRLCRFLPRHRGRNSSSANTRSFWNLA